MENRFIRADDVAKELNVSKPYAYKLIRKLNEELNAKGFKKEADQARESGMDDVVTKPLDVDALLQKLSTLGAEQAEQEESV